MKASEIGQVKPYNLDEDYRDIIEPMNPFDVLTALMSLMNGQYSDLIMESIPIIMAGAPHLKVWVINSVKKGDKPQKPLTNKQKQKIVKKIKNKAHEDKFRDNQQRRAGVE